MFDAHFAIETEEKQPEHPWSPRVVAWITGMLRSDLHINAIKGMKYCPECSAWHYQRWREVGVDVRVDERVEADARLIAAAPDLLAALEFIAEGFDNQDVSHLDYRIKAAEAALEAIAKAKGETFHPGAAS